MYSYDTSRAYTHGGAERFANSGVASKKAAVAAEKLAAN